MNIKSKYGENRASILAACIVCAALAMVFVIAASGLTMAIRLPVFAAASAAAVLVVFWLGSRRSHLDSSSDVSNATTVVSNHLQEELLALEEAAVYFSASIKTDELVRVLRVRLDELFESCKTYFLVFNAADVLYEPESKMYFASPKLAKPFEMRQKLSELAVLESRVTYSEEILKGTNAGGNQTFSIAVPLLRGEEPFCVLVVSAKNKTSLPDENTLQSVSEKLAPLISGSIAFEASISNALTDNLTDLANERAMYLILENQIAEAQRFGKERRLSILALDISAFAEVNQKFGHVEGDKLLVFAAKQLNSQLRNMDFLARISDDEFLVILPTVSSDKLDAVIRRIRDQFGLERYKLPDGTSVVVELSYGGATFGEDGQTAAELLRKATERKRVNKSTARGSMLQFPDKNQAKQ